MPFREHVVRASSSELRKEKNFMHNFEKLEVWQLSIKFSSEIYKITREFPKNENFGLKDQLRRASVSIASNIAEGAGRYHKQDFIRFLRIAIGSTYECVTELFIAKNEKYIAPREFFDLYEKSTRICMMLNKLINAKNK